MTLPVHDQSPDAGSSAECAGCDSRRTFLRDVVGAAIALAGLSALAPVSVLSALEPRIGRGTVKYPIPAADGVSIDKTNEVIICRSGGDVFAFSLSCPHQNTALRALPGSAGFQCPRHKSRYQPNGTFISGRATRNMDRLPISRDGDTLVVDPDVAYESDTDNAKWQAAHVKL